jgi:hypothetical protein
MYIIRIFPSYSVEIIIIIIKITGIIYIYDLFKKAVSSSDYGASCHGMIIEWLIDKGIEGSKCHSQIKGYYHILE